MGAQCCTSSSSSGGCVPVEILNAGETKRSTLTVPDGAILHPVQATTKSSLDSVYFIPASAFLAAPMPYPRRQDAAFQPKVAEDADVVVCISHAWPYQVHPDPTSVKSQIINTMLEKARDIIGNSDPLLFFDFLSVTQRPRTQDEQSLFGAALEAMPLIYLRADAVIHIEQETTIKCEQDGQELAIPVNLLKTVELRAVRDTIQLCATPAGQDKIKENDTLVSVDGQLINSVDQAKQLVESGTTAVISKSPFGIRNEIPASKRGWIFLERFCSMVKVAMVEDKDRPRVVFANDPKIVEQIYAGGDKLRAAAKKSNSELRQVLQEFAEELKQKSFSGTSADCIQRTDALRDDAFSEEAKAVLKVMDGAISYLQAHWTEERERQNRRMLTEVLNSMSSMDHQRSQKTSIRDSDSIDALVLTYFPLIGRGEYIIMLCIEHDVPLRLPEFKGEFGPTGTIPNLRHGELELWDSLAIVQYIIETFPGPCTPSVERRIKALDWWAVLQDYYSFVLSPMHDIIMKLPARNLRLTDACRVCGAAASDMNGMDLMQNKLIDLHIQRTTYMEKLLQDVDSPEYLCGSFTYVDVMLYSFMMSIDKCKGFQGFRDAVKATTKSEDCFMHCPNMRKICNNVSKRPTAATRANRYPECDI